MNHRISSQVGHHLKILEDLPNHLLLLSLLFSSFHLPNHLLLLSLLFSSYSNRYYHVALDFDLDGSYSNRYYHVDLDFDFGGYFVLDFFSLVN